MKRKKKYIKSAIKIEIIKSKIKEKRKYIYINKDFRNLTTSTIFIYVPMQYNHV